MSSTLVMMPTPKPPKTKKVYFKSPVKAILARRYYDHDGSLGGNVLTVGPGDLAWFEGVLAGADRWSKEEKRDFEKMVDVLRSGGTVDMWFDQ